MMCRETLEPFRLGCQTITFGERQGEFLPRVFAAAAKAGYAGVEIGFRHIQRTPPDQLRDMLERAHLTLLATHVGGNLADTGQAGAERGLLAQVLDYLNSMNVPRLMYSGLKFKNEAQFQNDLARLRQAASECQRRKVHLMYHNHDWEFSAGGRVIEALLAEGGAELGFCPDIGWVLRGGADPLALLERMKNRLGAIHLKDFSTAGPDAKTVLLGAGVAPLKEAAAWVAKNKPGLWVVAEQDQAELPAEEAIHRNAIVLRAWARGAAAAGDAAALNQLVIKERSSG